jgi:microcystin-dependent protein
MDFQVVSAPDEFTVVDNTDDWVLYALADTSFTLEFVAVGLNDAALAIAAKDAAIAAADAAAADAALAQAAAVQTGLDAAATAADRVQTGLDAAATAADRVQTGLDAAATAADRVQTGLDAAATAADRVQTGLDVLAAEAAAALATSVIPTGGTTSQALVKASNADYDYAWASISGAGDMVAAIYDPTAVGGDAFARANHHGTQLAATISDFSTAADARVSAAIGATVQAYNANLTTWAGIAPSANVQSLVGAADYAAMRALLDLEVGTDFLSPAAIAAAYAALVHTHTVSQLSDASANGRSLISAADYAAMRALLDLEAGTDFLSPAAIAAAYAALVHTHTVSQLSDASANGRSLISAANYAAMLALLSGVATTRSVATQHSLTGGGDLSANRTLNLVNDTASPGNNKVYGTDSGGTRGWKDDPAGGSAAPVGAVMAYAGSAAPSLWLLCYGQAVSRATYADLFTALSTTYGAGDGSTTFNLPDLRGRVPAGQDDMGGVSANRLTGVSGSVNGDTLGATGGEEAHVLATGEVPTHNLAAAGSGGSNKVTGYNSAGSAHNNVQPTIILNYIIYAGV